MLRNHLENYVEKSPMKDTEISPRNCVARKRSEDAHKTPTNIISGTTQKFFLGVTPHRVPRSVTVGERRTETQIAASISDALAKSYEPRWSYWGNSMGEPNDSSNCEL